MVILHVRGQTFHCVEKVRVRVEEVREGNEGGGSEATGLGVKQTCGKEKCERLLGRSAGYNRREVLRNLKLNS